MSRISNLASWKMTNPNPNLDFCEFPGPKIRVPNLNIRKTLKLFLQLSEFFLVYSLLFSSFLTSLGFHVFPCLSLLTLREGLFCASDPRHDQTNRFLDFLVAVSQQLREYMWICFRPQFFCLGQRVFCLNYVKIEFVFYGNFIRVLLSDSILFINI